MVLLVHIKAIQNLFIERKVGLYSNHLICVAVWAKTYCR